MAKKQKLSPKKKSLSKATDSSDIIDPAYNLEDERKMAANKGFPSEFAIFWKGDFGINFSHKIEPLSLEKLNANLDLVEKWLNDESLPLAFIGKRIESVPRYVTGVVYFAGDKWRVWNVNEVWNKLGEQGDPPRDEILVGYVGNADLSFSPRQPRIVCLDWAGWFLVQISSLYLQAKAAFPSFDDTFEKAKNVSQDISTEAILAVVLHRARYAVFDVIRHVHDWRVKKPDEDLSEFHERISTGHYLHGGLMLRQGFQIGRFILQAETLLLSPKWTKVIAKQSASRNKANSKFWNWICNEPQFKEKKAKELLTDLHGLPCPAYGGALISVDGKNIHAGEKKLMSRASFEAALSHQRKEKTADEN